MKKLRLSLSFPRRFFAISMMYLGVNAGQKAAFAIGDALSSYSKTEEEKAAEKIVSILDKNQQPKENKLKSNIKDLDSIVCDFA